MIVLFNNEWFARFVEFHLYLHKFYRPSVIIKDFIDIFMVNFLLGYLGFMNLSIVISLAGRYLQFTSEIAKDNRDFYANIFFLVRLTDGHIFQILASLLLLIFRNLNVMTIVKFCLLNSISFIALSPLNKVFFLFSQTLLSPCVLIVFLHFFWGVGWNVLKIFDSITQMNYLYQRQNFVSWFVSFMSIDNNFIFISSNKFLNIICHEARIYWRMIGLNIFHDPIIGQLK